MLEERGFSAPWRGSNMPANGALLAQALEQQGKMPSNRKGGSREEVD